MTRAPFTLSSIQSRMLFVVLVALALMLGGIGTISWLAIRDSNARAFEERLALARTNADHLGYVLNENLVMLGSVVFAPGADITIPNNEKERQALHDVYVSSIFDGGLYVIDAEGNVLMTEPEQSSIPNGKKVDYPPVAQALSSGRPVVSNAYQNESGQWTISAIVPVNKNGVLAGAIVGDIDPTGPSLVRVIPPLGLGKTGYFEVVDFQGTVVASNITDRILKNSDHASILETRISQRQTLTGPCHTCHEGNQSRQTEVMAFAPLSEEWVQWGVVLRQSEAEALAPSRNLLTGILLVSIPTLLLSIIMAWGMAQSVSRPIVSLTGAARRLSGGDLSRPIKTTRSDEIGTLSRALEAMRSKLNASLAEIKRWNLLLETKVEERTQELERLNRELKAKEASREELLHKVMTAQEEERKRLARDLHDDTSQTLAALSIKLDSYAASAPPGSDPARIEDMRAASQRALESIRRVILDLRPSILDDLGLISALRWYAEARLQEKGVRVRLETNDYEKRLPTEVETALFRIVQEAVSNIARHAEAENAVIAVDFQDDTAVALDIEDDGKGFDATAERERGTPTFGLQGMEERVALLGGTMIIDSQPGNGTRLSIRIPLGQREDRHV